MRSPGDSSFIVEYAALYDAVIAIEWDRVGEIEIAAWLNQSERHPWRLRVRNDPLNLRYCEVTSRLFDLARFVIDYPVINACFNAPKILPRKLISLGRTVVVDRIQAVNKDAEAHVLR